MVRAESFEGQGLCALPLLSVLSWLVTTPLYRLVSESALFNCSLSKNWVLNFKRPSHNSTSAPPSFNLCHLSEQLPRRPDLVVCEESVFCLARVAKMFRNFLGQCGLHQWFSASPLPLSTVGAVGTTTQHIAFPLFQSCVIDYEVKKLGLLDSLEPHVAERLFIKQQQKKPSVCLHVFISSVENETKL